MLDSNSCNSDSESNYKREIVVLNSTNVQVKSTNTKGSGANIVVVEDDKEIRTYLKDLLSQFFVVIEAANGIAGFEAVVEHIPDLIISDVMMPEMDGFELCEKVKSNLETGHIPILLLTAKGLPEDELFGTKKGADLYISKPFHPDLLLEKVRMLISSRKTLSKKYSKQIHLAAKNIEISNQDAVLIEQAINLIEENISDPNLNSEYIAKKMALSLSTLNRRLKKITNKTSHEFIISVKIELAARYLTESSDTISEIAYKVGYNEVKTFRRNFKDTFKMSPTEYKNEHSEAY
ncbi:response regulator transcription factor [Carboxylicivirga sp. N1Y90]|uniref:response regulator transcription factor n=1 Tax=Carboxylicivirga fragile TaxID=3417571 RepID=UPI003D33C642|nr:response regulator [Marinilabiliaceae bacterium N1Y90]